MIVESILRTGKHLLACDCFKVHFNDNWRDSFRVLVVKFLNDTIANSGICFLCRLLVKPCHSIIPISLINDHLRPIHITLLHGGVVEGVGVSRGRAPAE